MHSRDPALRLGRPGYGLDNRWNFNLFDPDGTRMEFMQVADPAHPAPAVAVTPESFGQNRQKPAKTEISQEKNQ